MCWPKQLVMTTFLWWLKNNLGDNRTFLEQWPNWFWAKKFEILEFKISLNILNPKSSSDKRRATSLGRGTFMVIRCPLSTLWKWQLVLYIPLRWRQGALISETPCSECTIHNIHKSIRQTIFFSFFSHDSRWAGQPAILYHRKNEKLKWGFSINWETHLPLQAFYFSKCLVNFDASVMTTSKYIRIVCPMLYVQLVIPCLWEFSGEFCFAFVPAFLFYLFVPMSLGLWFLGNIWVSCRSKVEHIRSKWPVPCTLGQVQGENGFGVWTCLWGRGVF